jgi:P-type conjugative transfer protein TrbJ
LAESLNPWARSLLPKSAIERLENELCNALVKGIVQQQAQIRADAATLERLQSQASTTDGQMKALMAANQLAALQQEELLQIRELLVQEQQALAARGQTLANDEAMREAATKKFFDVPLITINHTGW